MQREKKKDLCVIACKMSTWNTVIPILSEPGGSKEILAEYISPCHIVASFSSSY